jgi:high affinity sulfate transporter 1
MTSALPQTGEQKKAASRIPTPRFLVGIRGVKRQDLQREILAGITLAALMIPLNIGYAQVAGLPPIVGLYAAIVPMVVFALCSTSRNLVASCDAPIAALIGSLLVTLAAPGDPRYVQLALALALTCAAIFFLFWLFRLGFLANYLSRAVLIGFISGLGIDVFTNQLTKILGVSIDVEGYFRGVIALIRSIPQANLYDVAIGVGSIVIIRLLKRYAPRLPGALIALILMTALVAIFHLYQRGVSVLGFVPSGLPRLVFPQVSLGDYLKLLPGALAICGITLAEGLLIARQYSKKYGYPIDADQELFAFGAANIAGGLTGALVVGSSASRSASMDGLGVRSQLPSMVAAAVVAVVLVFFTSLLALLPNAALGGIVANSVLSLIEVGELRELFRIRRSEFWVATVCLLSVLVLGPLLAVIIAFLLSTVEVVRRAANPQSAVLNELPDGHGYYVSLGKHQAITQPGLIVYRFGALLFFANANTFTEHIKGLVENAGSRVEWLVLDAEAISDIDTTGAEALGEVIQFLGSRHVTLAIARASPPITDLLRTYNLLEKISAERLYPTNRDAVEAFHRETGRMAPARSMLFGNGAHPDIKQSPISPKNL